MSYVGKFGPEKTIISDDSGSVSQTGVLVIKPTSVEVTGSLLVSGDVKLASGSNSTIGLAVLDGGNPGTVTVNNTLVTANSIIFLTKQTGNHSQGSVCVSAKSSSIFTILSNHNGDTDTVAYFIVNPTV